MLPQRCPAWRQNSPDPGRITRRLPRRLGGVKGGESRADKQPKDPMRLFVRRMIEKHLESR